MLLAYTHPFGPQSPRPALCLIASKPDGFSHPIPVEMLGDTEAAVYRMSPTEGLRVRRSGRDNSIVLEPVPPSKLYLTPSQPDRPGFIVATIKIVVRGDYLYETFFKRDLKLAEWSKWLPYDFQ